MNTLLTTDSRPNFCDETGKAYLVKCPDCKKENYSPAVAAGQCVWCGYDLNEKKTIGQPLKKTKLTLAIPIN